MEQADGVRAAADRRRPGCRAGGPRPPASASRVSSPMTHWKSRTIVGIGVRAGGGADAIEGVVDVGDPVAQRLVHRVLEGPRAGLHRPHLGAEHLHAEHVRLLPLDVDRAHVDDAVEAEARAGGGGRDAVLAGARLGDDALLAHAPGEQDLAEHVVDLVRAGVVELVALEVDLRAAEAARSGARRNRAGSAARRSA